MEQRRGNCHILLINGDDRVRETRALLLESNGYSVEQAASYDAARLALAARSYDLLLLDVERKPEPALEFCDEIKAQRPGQLVGLIAGHHIWVPPSPCPDDVISSDHGPAHFVNRVKELVETDLEPATS